MSNRHRLSRGVPERDSRSGARWLAVALLIAVSTMPGCSRRAPRAIVQLVPGLTEEQARRMVANQDINVSFSDETGHCEGAHAVLGGTVEGLRALPPRPGQNSADMLFEVSPGVRTVGLSVYGLDGGLMFEGCRKQSLEASGLQTLELDMVSPSPR
jgi:hypothetical protein